MDKKYENPTTAGFEPTRAEPNALAGHRLNHSATLPPAFNLLLWVFTLLIPVRIY